MIFYNDHTNQWQFHTLQGLYKDTSTGTEVSREEYLTNRRYLEERVMQWPHFSNLIIRRFTPTDAQQVRLDDLNAAQVGQAFEGYVSQYVEHGYLDTPIDSQGDPVDLGHSYLNTLAGRPENNRRKKDVVRARARDMVATRRWEQEISGIVINGMTFGTSDREKSLMTAKVIAAMNKPGSMSRYKTDQGWVTLPASAMIEVGLTVENYVQLCFDREGELCDLINASEDPTSIDIDSGWPSREYTLDFTVSEP